MLNPGFRIKNDIEKKLFRKTTSYLRSKLSSSGTASSEEEERKLSLKHKLKAS